MRRAATGGVLGCALTLAFAAPAAAVNFPVDNLGDAPDSNLGNGTCATAGNVCTLRAAMGEAEALAGPDDITIGVTGDISLATALPDITQSVSIVGPGAAQLTVKRADGAATNFRVFTFSSSSAAATLRGLTITNGRSCDGGGLSVSGGTFTLREVVVQGNTAICSWLGRGGGVWAGFTTSLRVIDSTIRQNQAIGSTLVGQTDGGRAEGGGIWIEFGSLFVRGSTVSGNSTAGANSPGGGCGGAAMGGGIWAFQGAVIESSTISGNHADVLGTPVCAGGFGKGGGVVSYAGTVALNGVTLADNTAATGGTSVYAGFGGDAVVNLKSTILDSAGTECEVNMPGVPNNGEIHSQGFNMAADTSCGLDQPTDLIDDPELGPLGDNDGPTETHAILATSPAADKGIKTAALDAVLGETVTNDDTDQRGLARPVDLAIANAAGGDGTDIGAFEFQTDIEPPDPACSDGVDNDLDQLTDFPADPGCANADDDDEFNIPPPACSDGVDNDLDDLIDFPADPGCANGADTDETDAPATPAIRCRGKIATVVGTSGANTLGGTGARDVIAALGGNDRINGRGGKDLICAGAGRDAASGGGGNDDVFGEGGKDRLRGGGGKDDLNGGAANDSCAGGGQRGDKLKSC